MIHPCGNFDDARPTVRVHISYDGRTLWDDDAVVDTGFNAALAIPESRCSGLPSFGVGNINEGAVPMIQVDIEFDGSRCNNVPAARVANKPYPIVGIQFLELFQVSLFVQKVPTENQSLAFLASNDEEMVAKAHSLYWNAKLGRRNTA